MCTRLNILKTFQNIQALINIRKVMLYWKHIEKIQAYLSFWETFLYFFFSFLLFSFSLFYVLGGMEILIDKKKCCIYSWSSFRKFKVPNNLFKQINLLIFHWQIFQINTYSLLNCNDPWQKSAQIHRTLFNTHFKPQGTEEVDNF